MEPSAGVPPPDPAPAEDGGHLPREELLLLAASDEAALSATSRRLAGHLAVNSEVPLSGVAAASRREAAAAPAHRRILVCRGRDEAIAALGDGPAASAAARTRAWSAVAGPPPPVSFLFAGVGDQYPGMARGLYSREAVFRRHLDRCAEILLPWLGLDVRDALLAPPAAGHAAGGGRGAAEAAAPPRLDLRQLLGRVAAQPLQHSHPSPPSLPSLPSPPEEPGETLRTSAAPPPAPKAPAAPSTSETPAAPAPSEARVPSPLDRTLLLHPAIFAVEYALAQLWLSWGIAPRSLLGYSIGEVAAACLAGVFELEAALRLVAVRARAIDALPAGAMLSVFLSEAETVRRLGAGGAGLSLAAVNGPTLCVVAGPPAAVAALEEELRRERIPSRRLAAAHAFHSAQMEPAVEPLVREAAAAGLRPPALPLVSNVTGRWITAAEATDPHYWARHMCRTVRFADGAATLCAGRPRALVEIGPGTTLGSMVLQAGLPVPPLLAVPSLPHADDPDTATATVLTSLGKLWLAGAEPDWAAFEASREPPRPGGSVGRAD